MKAARIMLSAIFSAFTLFLASSLYTGILAQQADKSNEKLAIVFDLGGVVFHTDKLGFFLTQLGWRAVLYRSGLKKRWFALLDKIAEENNNQFKLAYSVKDEDGATLPNYMAEWMVGTRSNEAIHKEICDTIKAHSEWFGSGEQQLMLYMADGIFLPERFVSTRYNIAESAKLLKKLKKQGYPLYVLSNWDKESFAHMQEKYPDIFEQFDGCIVSGLEGKAKPDPEIYKLLEWQYPHNSYIFLDDQQDNIAAAEENGWHTVPVKTASPDKKKLYKEIRRIEDEIAVKNGKLTIALS